MNLEDLGLEDGEIVEKVNQTVQEGRNLVPWLPDPFECDNCGSYCLATTEFVDAPGHVGYTDVWSCPDCSKRYYRDRI